MINSRCCSQLVHPTHGVLAVNTCTSRAVINFVSRMYSKGKKDKGSENPTQSTEMDGPLTSAWRPECPKGPQPPNYDPYRIKVPEVAVPPMPCGNAKALPNEDSRDLFQSPNYSNPTDSNVIPCRLFQDSTVVHPDYWKDRPQKKLAAVMDEVIPKLGYHGKNKYKYAFHEPWNPLDRITLLEKAEKQELEQLEPSDDTKQPDKEAA